LRCRPERLELRQALRGDPERRGRCGDAGDALLPRQLRQPVTPAIARIRFPGGDEPEPDQRIVQFIAIGGVGPRFGANARDRVRIKPAEIGCGLGREPAPAHHRLRSAFLQRRVIKIRVRSRGQHLKRQWRRLIQVAGDDSNIARLDPPQQPFEAVEVHGLADAVRDGLAYQRMVGDLAIAGQVLGTGELVGENRPDQVLRCHPRELGRHLPAAAEARKGKRDADHPAPARDEHRRVEQRLDQKRPDAGGVQIA
jgi:hypothetical protein